MMNRDKSKIEWIFFDLGSTLIDETEVYVQRFAETVRGSGVSVPEFRETAIRFWTQGQDGYPQAAAYYELKKAPWRSEYERLFDGCTAVLDALKARGCRLGVIANQVPGTAERLKKWGILQFFDVIAPSAELGMAKPDPAIFLWALNAAGCKPENAVMVGDRIDNDILPAQTLGMKTVRILTGPAAVYRPADDPSDRIVKGLSDLLLLF
ncbi:MAG: HAD family hydrolase [Clostridia bacterium]|nr:HAD family hydrolase [Clostridia bacterium]